MIDQEGGEGKEIKKIQWMNRGTDWPFSLVHRLDKLRGACFCCQLGEVVWLTLGVCVCSPWAIMTTTTTTTTSTAICFLKLTVCLSISLSLTDWLVINSVCVCVWICSSSDNRLPCFHYRRCRWNYEQEKKVATVEVEVGAVRGPVWHFWQPRGLQRPLKCCCCCCLSWSWGKEDSLFISSCCVQYQEGIGLPPPPPLPPPSPN